ncbi:hypothetical protein JOD45_001879 [Scopulibacillus daqui]|uniref:HNH/ENDO VII superfamily nuclease n=1 Tax=Scopulibacillus daqui TaxID=1469162 RepID=A0ABS2Q027_9BACL|nr:HNH endonuclease [Scopulibacillus daqui]MBM7645661.1 hypothetical protein [Scopulibacillus daqui]
MGQIKVDPDRLEELADKASDVRLMCGEPLDKLKWSFSSLLAEVSDLEGSYASTLLQEFINHIEHYMSLLDQSQDFLMKTAAEYRQADATSLEQAWNVIAEILPIHDMERTHDDYDPVTGEKIGLGDDLLASTLIFTPEIKDIGLGIKYGTKGIKLLENSKKTEKLVKGMRNVLNPDVIKRTFVNSYRAVKNQSLSLTNKIVKKIGDIRLPQGLQPEYAGIGKMDLTVRDVAGSAKDNIMKIVDREAGVVRNSNKGNPVKEAKDDYFIGKLKGEKIHFKGIKTEEIVYTKRHPEEVVQLRKKFNSSIKKNFLKEFANDPKRIDTLKKAGLDENDIARMKKGLNPEGWQVHHNLPLDDGGTNEFSNLVLIKNDPYHKAITNEQIALTKELAPKQSKTINWPMIKSDIYPLKPFKRRGE